jgi:hypothetical protein
VINHDDQEPKKDGSQSVHVNFHVQTLLQLEHELANKVDSIIIDRLNYIKFCFLEQPNRGDQTEKGLPGCTKLQQVT